jgi:hypothetical protein
VNDGHAHAGTDVKTLDSHFGSAPVADDRSIDRLARNAKQAARSRKFQVLSWNKELVKENK